MAGSRGGHPAADGGLPLPLLKQTVSLRGLFLKETVWTPDWPQQSLVTGGEPWGTTIRGPC